MARNVLFLQGTAEKFSTITPDNNTFYLVGGKDLYLGSQKLNNQAEISAAVERVAKNEGDISTLRADLDALTGGSGSSSISSMLATLKTELEAYADSAVAVETGRAQTAEGNLQTAITNLEKKVDDNETDIEKKVSDLSGIVAGHTTTIAEHTTDISELDQKIDGEVSTLEGKISAVDTRVDNLLGADKPESGPAPTIRAIAEDAASKKVDAIVDNAPESFNTLKEIADWITNDDTGAASVAATVAQHGQAIQDLETADQGFETRIKANEDAIDALEQKDTNLEGRLQAVETAAGEIDSKIGDAKEEVLEEVESLESTVSGQIEGINGRLDGHDQSIENHEDRLSTVEEKAEDTAGLVADHAGRITTAEQGITALQNLTNGYGDIVVKNWSDVESAIATARGEAYAYTDECLTWGSIA